MVHRLAGSSRLVSHVAGGSTQNIENNPMQSSRQVGRTDALCPKLDSSGKSLAFLRHRTIRETRPGPAMAGPSDMRDVAEQRLA